MADGATHAAANIVAGVGMCVLAPAFDIPLLPVIIGAGIGVIITPDYDLEGTTITEKALRSIPLFGTLWMASWYTYALKFRHRGWSHSPLLGTPVRALFLCAIILFWYVWIAGAAWVLFGASIPRVADLRILAPADALIALGAWWLQDMVHYLLDIPERGRRRL